MIRRFGEIVYMGAGDRKDHQGTGEQIAAAVFKFQAAFSRQGILPGRVGSGLYFSPVVIIIDAGFPAVARHNSHCVEGKFPAGIAGREFEQGQIGKRGLR
jgi:hypothetical protein